MREDWTECRKKRPMQEECPVVCTIEDTNSGKREVHGECFYKAETGWHIKNGKHYDTLERLKWSKHK